jgi:hypothetical protein
MRPSSVGLISSLPAPLVAAVLRLGQAGPVAELRWSSAVTSASAARGEATPTQPANAGFTTCAASSSPAGAQLYLSLSTAQSAAATVDVYVYGYFGQ